MSEISADRLERILDAARSLIQEQGMEGLTIRALAARSRVSPVTLYNRFGNKDNIVSLVVIDNFERHVDARARRRASDASPLYEFEQLIAAEGSEALSQPSLCEALLKTYFTHGNQRELPDLLHRMICERMMPLLAEMQELRLLHQWADIGLVGSGISDGMLGVMMNWSQGKFVDKELPNRLLFGTLSCLAAFSDGQQRLDAEARLKLLSSRISSPRQARAAKAALKKI